MNDNLLPFYTDKGSQPTAIRVQGFDRISGAKQYDESLRLDGDESQTELADIRARAEIFVKNKGLRPEILDTFE